MINSRYFPDAIYPSLSLLASFKESIMKHLKSSLSLAIALALQPVTSYAQDADTEKEQLEQDIEVITVQSSYRQNSLQSSTASIAVLSSQDIDTRNAINLEEVLGGVANINFSSGSQRARYFQVRGIGERSQFQEPINPSVGLIIDDIDFSGIGSVASTFDIEQIEFFRGPQGTRFGANALAGLIYMSSNRPSDDFEGAVRLTAANYNSYDAGVVLSGPASDAVNYRIVAEKMSVMVLSTTPI